jgi:hypothetical protein
VGSTRTLKGLPNGVHLFQVASLKGEDESAFIGPIAVVVGR